MSARAGLILFTALWVLTSLASGQDAATQQLTPAQNALLRRLSSAKPETQRPVTQRPVTQSSVTQSSGSQAPAVTSPATTMASRHSVAQPQTRTAPAVQTPKPSGLQSANLRLKPVAAATRSPQPPAKIVQASHSSQGQTRAADSKSAAKEAEPFLDLRPEATVSRDVQPEDATNSELFMRLGVWTVIILCCCFLVVLGIRYWQRSQGILPQTDNNARVLRSLSLGGNRTISLVQLGDVRALVGCDSSGVSNIVLAPQPFDMEMMHADAGDGQDPPDELFEGTELAA